jgi:transposase
MEACCSAHHWARKLQGFGHAVRLISPQFVKPCVKSNKNDAADAEAICEAVARPNMRFVPLKTVEQQAVLPVHRVRQGYVKALDRQVEELEAQIKAWHQGSELSRKLEKIPGIGPLAASALAASIGNARSFKNDRQVAAWLGRVPKQDHRLLRRSRNDGKQVRPWLAEPKTAAAPRVHVSDREPTSQSHLGQRNEAAYKVRVYGCNLFLPAIINRKLGKPRGVHVRPFRREKRDGYVVCQLT